MSALWAILAKDLLAELRLRQVLPTMFVLALVLITVFGLTTAGRTETSAQEGAAILWLAFAFAGLLAVERVFASEKESHTLAALLAAPGARQTVYVAKCLAAAVMLLVVQAFTLPVAALWFEYALAGPALPLVAVLLLGDAALVIVGTLAAAMVLEARVRGPLLSVLALPLLVPVLIFSTIATGELVAYGYTDRAQRLLLILGAFDLVFSIVAYLLFPHVIEN